MTTLPLASFALAAIVVVQAPFPQAEISNGRIHAKIYLPDAESGYYRATRFDWSGVISSLEWRGHSYFGQWFQQHDPKKHDAITGPVEEFTSVGYADTRPGESFIRIGVGAVRKPDEPAYRQFATYEIADPGKRAVTKKPDSIEFIHEVGDTAGYAYVYRKVLRLDGDALVLEHHLRNTGRKPIVTTVYDHDFFMLDGQPTGPDFVVRFPFALTAKTAPGGLAEIRGKDFVFLQELQPRQSFQTELLGFGASPADYDFRVENHRTGAAVRQTGDRPMSKINLWFPRTAICPEAFLDLRVEPGRETSWKIRYQFYEVGAAGRK